MGFKEALFYKKLPNKKVKCQLCPHQCILENGEVGKCNARMNILGSLKSLNYSKVYEVSNDKIENQGVYHFLPNKESMKIIIPGENLIGKYHNSVLFSQETPTANQTARGIISQIEKTKTDIVFYAGEPIIFYEYMKDLSEKNKKRNIMSSKGFIEIEPLRKISKILDSGIFEIQSMREEYYKEILGGNLESVLKAIKEFYENEKWIEIRMPLIKEFHHDFYDVRKLVSWMLNELNNNVPLHFISTGDEELVKKSRKIAIDAGMKYVYTDNIDFIEGKTTFCPNCKKPVIIRRKDNIEILMKKEKCKCGEDIAGVWQ